MTHPAEIRVAAVQYALTPIADRAAFEARVAAHVAEAAAQGCDFVTFPEFFTFELLSVEKEHGTPAEGVRRIAAQSDWFRMVMAGLAKRHAINIVAGTQPVLAADGAINNVCHVFLRDGTMVTRDKLHPTPDENRSWGITGSSGAGVIATDCGPVGVMICYDSEFPELARHLVDQGALVLFVPYCTDDRRGHLRVRYCSQARAVENQCYVVTAGLTGTMPEVPDMTDQYAISAILTPSDTPFAPDGIAAEAEANRDALITATLSLTTLVTARESGTVRNLGDRRHDLYRVEWLGS